MSTTTDAAVAFALLSNGGAEPAVIANEIFEFSFRAGVELGHELGHMCADAEEEAQFEPPGYL